MFCKNCGKQIKVGSKFCKYCDQEIKVSKFTLFLFNFSDWLKNHRKGLLIGLGVVIVLIILDNSITNQPHSTSLNNSINQTSPGANQSYDQNKIKSSVVNIICDNKNGGSGTLFTEDGYILTNNHVISGSTYCLVTLPNTATGAPLEIYNAEPIIFPNLSKKYDIAILKIDKAFTDKDGKSWGVYPTVFPVYTAPSSCDTLTPQLGDSVTIYGYPVTSGGYNLTITDGIISSFTDDNYILTSAKVDSGNSGGLALYQDKCFLGIPSDVVSGNYQNLGVIIPSYIISDFSDQVKSQQNTITP
jgi:S1-C subfamily serine protease